MNSQLNQILKTEVTKRAANPAFVHHDWFVKFHLAVVDQIARELCQIYKEADPMLVEALVWLHDYEKIVDFDNQYNTELGATKQLMQEVGYSTESIDIMADRINIYNAKQDLASAAIEIQIVSSADAASHLVGPFVTLYWYENPDKSIEELQTENLRKFNVDWEKKVTLPEIKQAFLARREHALEIAGQLPKQYFS